MDRRQFVGLATAVGSGMALEDDVTRRDRFTKDKILWIAGDSLHSHETRSIGAIDNSPIMGACQWFNPPGIGWMSGYETDHTQIDGIYKRGLAMHMIVWIDPDDNSTAPPYLTSTGTGSFLDDHLPRGVNMFKGETRVGPFYVTLFTEFDAMNWEYNLTDTINTYKSAVAKIKNLAPWAKVGLGLGGYNWPTSAGGTRDLSPYQSMFDVSDFLCTQIMQDSLNVSSTLIPQFKNAIAQLGTYNKPVMISHLNMWGAQSDQIAAWQTFQNACFTDEQIRTYLRQKLFAINLMQNNGQYSDTSYLPLATNQNFNAEDGQWHASDGLGTTTRVTDVKFEGTHSLKHTRIWPTGESSMSLDNFPRAGLNILSNGTRFGIRLRIPYALRGLRARLQSFRSDNVTNEYGEWWNVPNGSPFDPADFFQVSGNFSSAMMSDFGFLVLHLYHPSGPGTSQDIYIDLWDQGSNVPQWKTGLDAMRKYATRLAPSLNPV